MNKEFVLEATGSVIDPSKLVSDIVRFDYRTAPVFREYNISYCCATLTSLRDICKNMGIPENEILRDLQQATRNRSLQTGVELSKWKTDFLIDYIIQVHHAYLYGCIAEIHLAIVFLMDQHTNKYPELVEVFANFSQLSDILIAHNRNEEEVIFPYIRQLDSAFFAGEAYAQLFVRTLRKPLTATFNEHQEIAGLLTTIQTSTNNYRVPENAHTNHYVFYGKLHELHDDLAQHKYLENNILLPRVAKIELELLSK